MVGKVGQDSFGQELLSSASASGVDVSRVIRDPEAPSAVGNVQLEVTPVIYGKLTYARVKLIGTAIMSVVLHHKPIILLI